MRIQKLRADFVDWMKDVEPERLVFIDEAGSTVAMSRLRGRSRKGQR